MGAHMIELIGHCLQLVSKDITQMLTLFTANTNTDANHITMSIVTH